VAGRARVRRSVRRNKDLIWVTTLIQAGLLEAPTGLDLTALIIPGDWSLSAGFDRATLMSIRGSLAVAQSASGTGADAPGIWLAIYVTDSAVASGAFDPGNAADYALFDVLYTDSAAGIGTVSAASQRGEQINVKTRRKINSGHDVRLAYNIPADTATPRWTVFGMLRVLLKLDP